MVDICDTSRGANGVCAKVKLTRPCDTPDDCSDYSDFKKLKVCTNGQCVKRPPKACRVNHHLHGLVGCAASSSSSKITCITQDDHHVKGVCGEACAKDEDCKK